MAFTVATCGGAGILYNKTTPTTPYTLLPSSSSSRRRTLHLVSAKKISSRSRRNQQPTTTVDEEVEPRNEVEIPFYSDEDWPFEWRPPGTYKEPDFFEGPQWNTVGFVGEWLWILGGLFAVLGGGYAAINYNLGASDFKETPAYKESQSQELLEQPETSESDIFESNPTEVLGGGYAAINYNLGASDFKETPAYKESQSQELLEQPETSESDIFESNPTEVAPSLN